MANVIRVLVVDDSAFVRKFLRQMLSKSPFIEVVAAARNGAEALEFVEQYMPDVVTLDLNMPGADGLAFLKTQMARKPIPTIVVSMAAKDGQQVLEALDAGAIDFIQKPTGLANERILEISEELILKVKTAAVARIRTEVIQPDSLPLPVVLGTQKSSTDIIVIGISTGGPQALRYMIPRLPRDLPVPVAIVLHMPLGYTELFANSLNELSDLEVTEAKEGQVLRPGLVLLAPAGFHLTFARVGDGTVTAHLGLQPLETPHRPAADVLFQSAADVFGPRTLAIVMTGMGSDGTRGAAWIKARGGRVFAEAEESCIVYGMPRSIVEAGLCDKSVPLAKMAVVISENL
ncbi:MAG: chemotaxis-specific protein-glutamate methyltransferase CheB [Planctomycetota bacterium]|nr:chemotaxis-specific protein-glutamate methyltransferase CheB [Planctomycetota bacterium]